MSTLDFTDFGGIFSFSFLTISFFKFFLFGFLNNFGLNKLYKA